MIKPDLKAQWIADLRSNVDHQGQNYLSKDNRECCLGRLCMLRGVPIACIDSVNGNARFEFKDSTEGLMPPRYFCESFGLDMSFAETLAEMNDQGYGFAAIANFIENHEHDFAVEWARMQQKKLFDNTFEESPE